MGSILGVVVGPLLLFPWVFVAVNAVGALLQLTSIEENLPLVILLDGGQIVREAFVLNLVHRM